MSSSRRAGAGSGIQVGEDSPIRNETSNESPLTAVRPCRPSPSRGGVVDAVGHQPQLEVLVQRDHCTGADQRAEQPQQQRLEVRQRHHQPWAVRGEHPGAAEHGGQRRAATEQRPVQVEMVECHLAGERQSQPFDQRGDPTGADANAQVGQ